MQNAQKRAFISHLQLADGLGQQQQEMATWEHPQLEQQEWQQQDRKLRHQWQSSSAIDEVSLQKLQKQDHQYPIPPHHQQPIPSQAGPSTTSSSIATKYEDVNIQINLPSQPESIYSIRSTKRRYSILLATSVISILVPFSDTVYLPALQVGKVAMCHHLLKVAAATTRNRQWRSPRDSSSCRRNGCSALHHVMQGVLVQRVDEHQAMCKKTVNCIVL
jgi:hypothetical protein